MQDSLLVLSKYWCSGFCMLKHRVISTTIPGPPMAVLRETQAFKNLAILVSYRELMILLSGLTELTVVRRSYLGSILKGPAPEGKGTVKNPFPV